MNGERPSRYSITLRTCALLLTVPVVLTACATVPTGPSVMALPGTGKNFDQFQADDAVCRDWARRQTGTEPGQAAAGSTVTGAAIGTVLGAAVGALIGAGARNPGAGAAIGAGVGLVGGTAVGAGQGATAEASVQRRYDGAYTQCMYAKGHQVPVRGAVRSTYTQQPAGPPPPPPPPPPAGWTPAPPASAATVEVPPPPAGPPPPPPPSAR